MVRFCFLLLIFIHAHVHAAFLPSPLIKENNLVPYVLIAEKSTHQLHLYKTGKKPKLIKSIPMTTGANAGDKTVQGDKKTPEGIYFFDRFLSRSKLEKRIPPSRIHLYGQGAFTSDYPNAYDLYRKKTGGGIWLHSSDDPMRIFKQRDTRGCPIIPNEELLELKNIIRFHQTPLIIVKDLNFWPMYKSNVETRKLLRAYQKFRGKNILDQNVDIFNHDSYAVIIEKEGNLLLRTYMRLDSKYQWRYLSQKKFRIKNELH